MTPAITPRRSGRRSASPTPGSAQAARIVVSIERLALHGFDSAEARRVAAAMEAELARLAARPEEVFGAANLATAAPVLFAPSRDPESTGHAAARALWSGIRGSGG
jgi:hypothetical protein